jgi:hypothetical protein
MKSLSIKDLSITEELDSRAMSGVRGGTGFPLFPSYNSTMIGLTQNVSQVALQSQTSNIMNGNNTAFSGSALTYSAPEQGLSMSNH